MANFTLQLLHHADFEGNTNAIEDAPELAALFDFFDDTYVGNTLKLSGGDNWIPSPWYNSQTNTTALNTALQQAYEELWGLDAGTLSGLTVSPGVIDQAILNILGIQASTLGNHEFDQGPDDIARIIEFAAATTDGAYTPSSITNIGSLFPYITTNLDFSANADLSDSYTSSLKAASAYGFNSTDLASSTAIAANLPINGGDLIAPYTTASVGGETIGLVGATTQKLKAISSPGTVAVKEATSDDMTILAAQVQASVDDLVSQGINKVILISHLQDYHNEVALAAKLKGVDIILSAGSDAIFADSTDTIKDGHVVNETSYPLVHTGADGNPILHVNTDGQYHYLGRLVVDFNENGVVIPTSVDPSESGAYATEASVIRSLYGNTDPYQDGSIAGIVNDLAQAIDGVVGEKIDNIAGYSDVFLDGLRATVRNQESNLGNLTADANKYAAEQFIAANPGTVADAPLVSLKNGGGIRAEIGLSYGVTGPEAPVGGEVNQLGIETALAFNNGLVIYPTTVDGLKALLEHGIDNAGTSSGRYPQVGGLQMSFDPSAPTGQKIQSLVVIGEGNQVTKVLVKDGQLAVPGDDPINVVTLNFLAEQDGDGYPFAANLAGDLIPLYSDEDGTFASTGYEQKAFYDYMQAFHGTSATAFDLAETSAVSDTRIQSLAVRDDSIDTAHPALTALGSYQTGLFGQGAMEIVAHDPETGLLLSVSALAAKVEILSLEQLIRADGRSSNIKVGEIDLSAFGGGVNSVTIKNSLAAVAIEANDKTDAGAVAVFRLSDIENGSLAPDSIKVVTVGALPDMVTFTPDGQKILVANEGEPNADYSTDPEGSVSVIDLSSGLDRLDQSDVTTLGFSAFNSQLSMLQANGVRIFGPNATVAQDLEPEYIAVSPDGNQAMVTLQEANAVAILDLSGTPRITQIKSLGLKDHSLSGNALDASDKDGIDISEAPIFGMYMPDAVSSYTANGQTYYVFANEGDSRDYDTFAEEARLKDVVLDADTFTNAVELQKDANLGRLTITTEGGADTDGDGDVDRILAFGGRSMSIRDSNGDLVWDSGSLMERLVADLSPEYFNVSNDNNSLENRSDNKGPEPEGVVVGTIGDETFAFVGLERQGGVMTFNITDPAAPYLVDYANNRNYAADVESAAAGDLGPEGLVFISADSSPTGKPLLVVANEVSGTLTAYGFDYKDSHSLTSGTDHVRGDAGVDTVVTSQQSSEVSLFKSTDYWGAFASIQNADRLYDVERIEFSDKKLALDLDGGQAGEVAKIIGAVFGADYLSPEFVGIGLDLYAQGLTTREIANFAVETSLFRSMAGGTSDGQFIEQLYEAVTDGARIGQDLLAALEGQLDAGKSRAELVLDFADSSENLLNIDLIGLSQVGLEYV